MEEWKKYRYSDLCSIIGGGTPKTSEPTYWNGTIPWLSVKDFGNENKYVYETEKHITEKGLNNSSTKLLQKGDIIISARGTVGELAVIPFPMAFNQSCFGIRANSSVDSDYLYYLTKTIVAELKTKTHGSVFDTITRDTFEQIECVIPSPIEQKKIASILSSLDEKIELNNHINHNLEELLFTIYSDMLPRCIGQQTIGNVASKVFSGGTPDTKQPSFWGGHINWLSSGETSDHFIIGTNKFITNLGLQESSTKYASKYDVVIASAGQGNTRGQTSLLLLNTCINQSVIAIHADAGHSFIIYCSLSNRYNELRAISDTSSIRGSLTTKMISAMEIPVFSQADQEMFTSKASSIISLIELNLRENYSLNKIRDIILPKMMTGQLPGLLHY